MEALTSPNTITLMAGLQQTAGKGQLLLLNKPSECCQVPCGVLTCTRKDVLKVFHCNFHFSVLSHLLVRKRGGFFLVFTVTSLCELTWLITLGSSGLNCSSLTKQKENLWKLFASGVIQRFSRGRGLKDVFTLFLVGFFFSSLFVEGS